MKAVTWWVIFLIKLVLLLAFTLALEWVDQNVFMPDRQNNAAHFHK